MKHRVDVEALAPTLTRLALKADTARDATELQYAIDEIADGLTHRELLWLVHAQAWLTRSLLLQFAAGTRDEMLTAYEGAG